jgi:hypothetical protein
MEGETKGGLGIHDLVIKNRVTWIYKLLTEEGA